MRILITGGMGFIGGRVATHLSNFGHKIVIASRKKNDAPVWLPKAQMFQLNWDNESNLRQACNDIDVVIHAAGMNSGACEENPEEALIFNGAATQRIVRASIAADVKTFIYLSTAHVYSRPLTGQINENTAPKNQHPYATSHLAGEEAVLSASSTGKIDGIVLRLSNIYGAPTYKDVNCWMLLVNDLCKQAATNQKIVLRSSGSQQRNFLTMSDACAVISSIILGAGKPRTSNVINIGSNKSETIHQMAVTIQERCRIVMGIKPKIENLVYDAVLDSKNLNYESLYALSLVGKIENDKNREIDTLLKFCLDSFSMK